MRRALRLHALAIAEAIGRIARQPVASLFSILVLAIAIALPVLGWIVLKSAGVVSARLDTDPHANVYLALDATDDDVKRIASALRANPEAAGVRFVPREQALEELKATTHLAELLSSMERNPLPHAFTVRLRTTDPAELAAAKAAWSRLPKVDQVVADFEWAQQLGRWMRFGQRLIAAAAVLLALAVAFIVGHLIRLQVLTRKEEIEVSRLIGATGRDVRRPFLYHGFFEGLFAGAGALGLAALAWAWLGRELSVLTPDYAAEFTSVFLNSSQTAVLVLGTAALSLAGAWLAVSRELQALASHR